MIGRKDAITILQNAYDSEQSELVVVYGRRRVGKTYLVNEVFGRTFAFHHSGLKHGSKAQQLKQFRLSLMQQGYDKCPALHDWQDAFFELGNMLARLPAGRKVVFIDEMPWMDTVRSNFMMAFEGFWNGWAAFRKDILLVVCGSATSWIINKVLHNKDGLHNRVSERIRLLPFTLGECEQYAAERGLALDRSQIATCYMAFGGVAYYWSLLTKGKSADQNIDRLFFGPQDGLRDEFEELYASLFADARPYEAIVRALCRRRAGLRRDELVRELGKCSGGDLTRHLEELEECGFIRHYRDAVKPRNGGLYQLMDNFTMFYLQFVEGNDCRGEDYWRSRVSQSSRNVWRGLAFERLCIEHVPQIKAALGISGVSTEAFSWRTPSDEVEDGAQIDLVIDRNDGIVNVCEMKWSNDQYAIDKDEHDRLMHRIETYRRLTATNKSLHLTMVTSVGLKRNEYWGCVQSEIVLDDLFRQ